MKAGADVIVVDGMQGGTAATQDVFIEHVGIPTLPAVRLAVDALQELGMHRQVQLIVSGGIRTGADVAKALALGADAVSIGTAALIALGDNSPELDEASTASSAARRASTTTGRPAATRRASRRRTTSSPPASTPSLGGRRLANYLRVLTLETQTLARACGKSHVHNLEPEDLVALTVEAAAMARRAARRHAAPAPRRAREPRRASYATDSVTGPGCAPARPSAASAVVAPSHPSSRETARVRSSSGVTAAATSARPNRAVGPWSATIAARAPVDDQTGAATAARPGSRSSNASA